MSDLERRLLSYATNTEALAKVYESGLRGQAFEEPIARAVYEFSIAYWQEHAKAPTAYAIETEFPGFKVAEEAGEDALWLAESLITRCAVNDLQEMVREAAAASHDDPIGALRRLHEASERAISNAGSIGNDGFRRFKASELESDRYLRWLAKDRIPSGVVSLLIGEEGIGKSLLWVWVVAAVTTGRAVPEFGIDAREPQRCLLVLTEDDWSITVRPRLEAAGADLNMVDALYRDADGTGVPTFPDNMHLITDEPHPALVVVDAWLDTVPAKLSMKDTQQARHALQPWKEASATTGAAILLLGHTNRISGGSIRDKYGATAQLRKICRITLFAQQDDQGRLVVGPDKANLSRKGVEAATFTIEEVDGRQRDEKGHTIGVPRLVYAGESGRTAEQWMDYKSDGGAKAKKDIDLWLKLLLGTGSRWAKEIEDLARGQEISSHKLAKAKQRCGVASDRDGARNAWYWHLRGTEAVPPEADPPGGDQGGQDGE